MTQSKVRRVRVVLRVPAIGEANTEEQARIFLQLAHAAVVAEANFLGDYYYIENGELFRTDPEEGHPHFLFQGVEVYTLDLDEHCEALVAFGIKGRNGTELIVRQRGGNSALLLTSWKHMRDWPPKN